MAEQSARQLGPYDDEQADEPKRGQSFKPEVIPGGGEDSSGPRGQLSAVDSPVYDQPGTAPSSAKPDLKALEGGGETSKPQRGHLKEAGSKGSPPSRDDLSDAEENGVQTQGASPHYEHQVGRGFRHGQPPSRFGRARAKIASVPTKWKVAAGGGIAGAIISILIFFSSFLSFGLIHLKHIATDNIGGVQGRVYTTVRGRLYSTMFFFDKEKNFSGYKATGIRRLMFENAHSKSMVQNLKDNGYEIKFAQDGSGRIVSLSKLDEHGKPIPEESYSSSSSLRRAWNIRSSGDLKGILRGIYPDKSDFWINRSSKVLYRRWGLTRTNWLTDYAKKVSGLTTLAEKELAFKKAMREKLFGDKSIFGQFSGKSKTNSGPACTDNTDTCTQSKDLTKLNSQFESAVNDGETLRTKELANPSYNGLGNDLESQALNASTLEKDAVQGVLDQSPLDFAKNINPAQAAIYACQADSALNKVVLGARILRSIQLMDFAMSVLNIADAVQNGQSVNSAQVSAMMTYLTSQDSNGHTLWDSSGIQYWTNSKHGPLFGGHDKNERDQYSVGGGFTGVLASFKNKIDKYYVGSACGVINNGFVQFLGLTVGVIGAIFTDGGSLTDFAANFGIGLVAGEAINIATQLLTPMVAGTVINGAEHGTAVGNAFVSGAETLANAVGASSGMRPLSIPEAKVAEASVQAEQKAEMAKTPLLARLFSPNQDRSLTTAAYTALSGSSFKNVLSSPISSLGNVLNIGNIFGSSSVLAADKGNSCPDTQLSDNNIFSTPFCNVMMGVPDSVLNSPDYAPDLVDQKMSCLDYAGNAIAGCTPQVDGDGNPIDGQPYADFVKQCTADTADGNDGIDVLHDDSGDANGNYTGTCTDSNPNINLFSMYHLYLTAAQSENDVLTGNLGGIGEGAGSGLGSSPGSGSSTPATPGSLTNPFPSGWIPNRLDMGYDGTFTDKIVAPFDGTIIYAGIFNGWKGSYGVEIKSNTSLGSAVPTDTLYFTEGVLPVVKSGDKVTAGTPIAKAYPSPYGNSYNTTVDGSGQIEWGVAASGPVGSQTNTYASVLGGRTCPVRTQASQSMVLKFADWAVNSLGLKAPATHNQAGCG